ncbi:MAG: hypothetical protein WCL08_05780 [Verrucomicrobiota bacterium]
MQLLPGEPAVQVEPEPVYRPAPVLGASPVGGTSAAETADLERRVTELELMVQLLPEQIASMQRLAAAATDSTTVSTL